MRAGLELLKRYSEALLLLLALVLLIRADVWMPLLITGESMLPTLHAGQIAGLNKLAYVRRPPERGDIVAVWTAQALIVKRIIGLPGEEISAQDGVFFINGQALAEPYVRFQDHWNIRPGKIAAGQFVVAGDNRAKTLLAVVARERILGRLIH
jgi:signal peptidase I